MSVGTARSGAGTPATSVDGEELLLSGIELRQEHVLSHVQTMAPDNAGCELNPHYHPWELQEWHLYSTRETLKTRASLEKHLSLRHTDPPAFVSRTPPVESKGH